MNIKPDNDVLFTAVGHFDQIIASKCLEGRVEGRVYAGETRDRAGRHSNTYRWGPKGIRREFIRFEGQALSLFRRIPPYGPFSWWKRWCRKEWITIHQGDIVWTEAYLDSDVLVVSNANIRWHNGWPLWKGRLRFLGTRCMPDAWVPAPNFLAAMLLLKLFPQVIPWQQYSLRQIVAVVLAPTLITLAIGTMVALWTIITKLIDLKGP